VHRGGGSDARINQCLRAFLALDQYHLSGADHPRLVVQRARLGRRHLAPLGVPGPELLLASRWVVAVDDGDETARLIEVIPLGGGWAEFVHRRILLAGSAYWHLAGATEQISSRTQNKTELGMDIEARMPGD